MTTTHAAAAPGMQQDTWAAVSRCGHDEISRVEKDELPLIAVGALPADAR
jgi:hypothetical protein